MTSDAVALARTESDHPLRGLGGMVGAELRSWFPWRVGLVTLAGFGIFAVVYVPWRASGVNPFGGLIYTFLVLWIAMLMLSVVALTEGSMLGEINRGTASWLVGMPIGRPAVVLAKFLAPALAVVTTVFVTGIGVYPILSNASQAGITEFTVSELTEVTGSPIGMWGRFTDLPAFGTYLATLLSLVTLLLFVVAVMLLLGSTIRSRTAVFALGLVVVGLFGAAALAGSFAAASPAGLIGAVADTAQSKDASFALPIVATAGWTSLVLLLAVWAFNRRELA